MILSCKHQKSISTLFSYKGTSADDWEEFQNKFKFASIKIAQHGGDRSFDEEEWDEVMHGEAVLTRC